MRLSFGRSRPQVDDVMRAYRELLQSIRMSPHTALSSPFCCREHPTVSMAVAYRDAVLHDRLHACILRFLVRDDFNFNQNKHSGMVALERNRVHVNTMYVDTIMAWWWWAHAFMHHPKRTTCVVLATKSWTFTYQNQSLIACSSLIKLWNRKLDMPVRVMLMFVPAVFHVPTSTVYARGCGSFTVCDPCTNQYHVHPPSPDGSLIVSFRFKSFAPSRKQTFMAAMCAPKRRKPGYLRTPDNHILILRPRDAPCLGDKYNRKQFLVTLYHDVEAKRSDTRREAAPGVARGTSMYGVMVDAKDVPREVRLALMFADDGSPAPALPLGLPDVIQHTSIQDCPCRHCCARHWDMCAKCTCTRGR